MHDHSFRHPLAALLCSACVLAQEAPAPRATEAGSRLAVREVTVFKDGHAFVLREGSLGPDAQGRVVIEELPVPVLGTFWPYAADGARVVSATAAKEVARSEKTALDLRQFVLGNAGRDVTLLDVDGEKIEGRLQGIATREGSEAERRLDEIGSLVLVATAEGTRALAIERVRDMTVKGEESRSFVEEELRDRLTIRVDRPERDAGAPATVGVAYVQKGLRWIPSYRVDIDGSGAASVELEATLVNDLIDLDDVTVNLVVGVPRFEFADVIDPISLQELAAQVAVQARESDRFRSFLSNAIMSQSAAYSAPPQPAQEPLPGVAGGEANEDLFVFTVDHVTLRKGERMVLPVGEQELTYRDVHVLDIPVAPPVELRDQFQGERVTELARLLASPKAMHALRIKNGSGVPLTTAPALVLRKGAVLAQGLMTYTPPGGETDLSINPAIGVRVEPTERETGRQPDAVKWNGDAYGRIDLAGAITLTDGTSEAIDVEVTRTVLGLVDQVGQEGTAEQRSLAEFWSDFAREPYWSWWSWPYWWHHFNGVGRFTWKVHLEPGQSTTLESTWHYFWR